MECASSKSKYLISLCFCSAHSFYWNFFITIEISHRLHTHTHCSTSLGLCAFVLRVWALFDCMPNGYWANVNQSKFQALRVPFSSIITGPHAIFYWACRHFFTWCEPSAGTQSAHTDLQWVTWSWPCQRWMVQAIGKKTFQRPYSIDVNKRPKPRTIRASNLLRCWTEIRANSGKKVSPHWKRFSIDSRHTKSWAHFTISKCFADAKPLHDPRTLLMNMEFPENFAAV